MKDLKTHYQIQVTKFSEEDNFENGCDYETATDYGVIETLKASTLLEALKVIKESYGTPVIFENRLEFHRMEDENGEEATKREIEFWKEGKTKLWASNYSFYISRVETENLDYGVLSEAFPDLETEGV